jgi:pimeloyl-ACP methyl ester carboxylesterase
MYRNLIPLLAGRYRLIAPDDLGLGLSDAPPLAAGPEQPRRRRRDRHAERQRHPGVHACLRESRVPLLAAWGRNDPAFGPEGALAFADDLIHERGVSGTSNDLVRKAAEPFRAEQFWGGMVLTEAAQDGAPLRDALDAAVDHAASFAAPPRPRERRLPGADRGTANSAPQAVPNGNRTPPLA